MGGASPRDRLKAGPFPRFGGPHPPGPEHPRGQADQGTQPQRRCRLAFFCFPTHCSNSSVARTFHYRTVTPQGQPTLRMLWRLAKRWGRCAHLTESQKAHQTGMGRRSIASGNPAEGLAEVAVAWGHESGRRKARDSTKRSASVSPAHQVMTPAIRMRGCKRPACPVAATWCSAGSSCFLLLAKNITDASNPSPTVTLGVGSRPFCWMPSLRRAEDRPADGTVLVCMWVLRRTTRRRLKMN